MSEHVTVTGTDLRLNLGCADKHLRGFVNCDIAPPADKIVDLSLPWLWADNSAVEIYAMDIAEHIGDCDHQSSLCIRCYASRRGRASGCCICGMMPCYTPGDGSKDRLSPECQARFRHPLGRIHVLNELWRVMRPGAICHFEVPSAIHGSGFAQDPTHTTPYCLSTFKYFEEGAFARQRLGTSYGITARFKVLDLSERETNGEDPREKAWKISATLEAVK